MRKITALILATVMVALCFSLATTASAEDTNLLAGMSYTVGGDATPKDAGTAGADTVPGTLLTDGAIRTPEEMNSTGGPVSGKTLEYQGTYKNVSFTFEFDEAVSIATIVADGARGWDVTANDAGDTAPNRHCNIAKIEVSTDGLNYSEVTYTVAKVAIEGSAQYGANAPADQFWTITATLAEVAANVTGLRVTLDTTRDDGSNAYIVQLDELEAYAGAAVVAPESSEEEVVASSEEEAASSEEEVASSEDAASSEEEIVVADTTFKVEAVEAEDGKVTVTITVPAGTNSGTIVIALSEDLEFTAPEGMDLMTFNKLGGQNNFNYETDDGKAAYAFNFAVAENIPVDMPFIVLDCTLAAEATLDDADIIVYDWTLGNAAGEAFDVEDGAANVIVTPIVPEVESSEETTEETTEESSKEEDKDTPNTGDAGVAVFAVLALVSAAAVVVIKKRA